MATQAIVSRDFHVVVFLVEKDLSVGCGVFAILPLLEGVGMAVLARLVDVHDVVFREINWFLWISRKVLHDAVEVRFHGVDVQGQRTAVAVAAVHRAVGGLRPFGVDFSHFVAGDAGVLRIAEVEIGRAPE